MKQVFVLCLFFCCLNKLSAQDADEYAYADQQALSIPTAQTYSTASIANYFSLHLKTETAKLRAIYTWVTANIRYDPDSMYMINSDKDPAARITAALRRRKGVCENYAAIFNDIAVKAGIMSYTVSGYTRQGESIDRSGHTWCAVRISNEWFLCDPTWDEGARQPAKWFLVIPAHFIQSHMPFDPLWQLSDQHMSHKQFYAGNFYAKKQITAYSFTDDLNTYLQLDSLAQFEAAINRIKQAGLANQLIINRLAYIKMQAHIIYEEKDMQLYNAAVADYNNANNQLNTFIEYRNRQFEPALPDAALNRMLTKADSICTIVNQKIALLSNSAGNSQYDPRLLNDRLSALLVKLQGQKEFLKTYISTAPALRKTLFYR